MRQLWVYGALLLLATALVFTPLLHAGFIRWDDQYYVEENPLLRDLAGLKAIWNPSTRPPKAPAQPDPLVFSVFWLEYQLWGVNPHAYHAVNLALHLINVILVLVLIWRLGTPLWIAALVAAVFAFHPVQVASVAWVSELKNTLSTVFYLGAFLLYLRHRRMNAWGAYAACLLTFGLALLSKAETITFPFSLALADWILQRSGRLRRISVSVLAARMAPMVALGVLSTIVTLVFEQRPWTRSFTPLEHLLIAANAAWFYVHTFVAPLALSPIYPKWEVAPSDVSWWVAVIAWPAALALVAIWWRRLDGLVLWGLAQFLIAVAPMLGLVSFNYQTYSFVADHYLYLSVIGGGLAVVVGAMQLAGESTAWSSRHKAIAGVLVLLIAAWAALAHEEAHHWRTNETFWTRVLERDPNGFLPNYNLGNHYRRNAEWSRALPYYQRAIEIWPNADYAFRMYAQAVSHVRGPQAGVAACTAKLTQAPNFAAAYLERALSYERLGEQAEALRDYGRAMALAAPGSQVWAEARRHRAALQQP